MLSAISSDNVHRDVSSLESEWVKLVQNSLQATYVSASRYPIADQELKLTLSTPLQLANDR